MSSPARRPSTPKGQPSSMQIVFGSILAISLLLAINFSGRIAAGRRIEDERDNLQEVIGTLQARATALRSELNFVQSDSYIEQWARAEGKMVKGDEMLVVPVPGLMTPAPIPTPFIPPQANDSRGETQNWRLWWQLFFDSPPPDDSSNR